ncbi:MAG: hypothetical protein U0573_02820 [Phycisphaerales bacterium]|nr:hypothetical protein [Planctomycetota bacterium]
MAPMSRWADVFRSNLFVQLLACLLIGAAFVPSAEAGAKRKPSVLIVHSSPYIADTRTKLNSSGQFGAVDLFNAGSGTPTLAALKAYDAVMLVSDSGFADPTTLGNNLADYVDAGGGVVNSVFSLGISPPAGRWNSGYLVMPVASPTQGSVQTLDLASITDQNHPILIGVGSFSGGSSSYRMNQSSVVAGATIVAKWTGGNVLVAAGPLPGRVDLNFYSPSKDARVDFWDTTTDGIKLMVNSLLYVMRPKVLLLPADSLAANRTDVQAKLRATEIVGQVDIFDTTTSTPTLAQLQAYDAVMTWSSSNYNNATALGNVLADFVDAGGGVVSAVFTTAETATARRLGGRWITGGYEIIPGASSFTTGAASLGAVAYAAHPIMSGVASFNGGNTSFRPNTFALNSGGLILAKWSDGKTLAAVSTKMPNRADLGMWPPSSTVFPGAWVAGTNGDKLMANALLYTVKPYVACVPADDAGPQNDVVAKLAASRRFSGVGLAAATASTPALATLKQFNAVLTWSFYLYSSPSTLANTLADFVDAGGGEVTGLFTNVVYDPLPGRWVTDGYEIVPSPVPTYTFAAGQAFLGSVVEPSSPISSFVRKFDGGSYSSRANSSPLLRGRTILKWSDGKMLASVHNFRKRADLGFWPVSDAAYPGAWNQRTDGTWITANALEWVVRARPCPGDFNGDGQVDDSDFVLFVSYYDAFVDPRGDLNGDGNTDDADFVVFVSSYDALTCP